MLQGSDGCKNGLVFFFVDFAFHPSPQTKIGSIRPNFKQLYLHTHLKLDTCLYETIYSEYSILAPPKTFTVLLKHPVYTHIKKQKISTAGKTRTKFLLVFLELSTCFGLMSHNHDLQFTAE
jgi:hypothetical protein